MNDSLIKALERKLVREKKARQLAEKQLEEYSLEIYEANQSLRQSLQRSEKSKLELEFLNKASLEISSDSNVRELLQQILGLVSNFFSASMEFYFLTDEKQAQCMLAKYSDDGTSNEVNNELLRYLKKVIDIDSRDITGKWLIYPFNNLQWPDITWLVYSSYFVNENLTAWLLIATSDDYIDEEFLYVLETSHNHLQSGIKRRLYNAEIQQQNNVLHKTIENLEQTKKQLIQSEKMASLGQLAAGVAHEINNPIGYIRSNLETLNQYVAEIIEYQSKLAAAHINGKVDSALFDCLTESSDVHYLLNDTRDIVKTNLEGLERVNEIVKGLKTFSHTGIDDHVPISLSDVIAQALQITQNYLKHQCDVQNLLENELPLIKGNPSQLQQVFVNLFVNAADAMTSKGVLKIEGKQQNDEVLINISDNGKGMEKETVEQLFTPFFTTKPVGEGTGLGLSVSYGILESHGATISVESDVGLGTKFTLCFKSLVED